MRNDNALLEADEELVRMFTDATKETSTFKMIGGISGIARARITEWRLRAAVNGRHLLMDPLEDKDRSRLESFVRDAGLTVPVPKQPDLPKKKEPLANGIRDEVKEDRALIERLLETTKGIPAAVLDREHGLSQSAITKWRAGDLPTLKCIRKANRVSIQAYLESLAASEPEPEEPTIETPPEPTLPASLDPGGMMHMINESEPGASAIMLGLDTHHSLRYDRGVMTREEFMAWRTFFRVWVEARVAS